MKRTIALILLFPLGFPLLTVGFVAALIVCALASGWVLADRFLAWALK